MSLRRLALILGVTVATGTLVAAAPAKKKAPPPGAGSGSGSGSGAGSGLGSGSAVEPIEEAPPPSVMNGTDDNPDNPHAVTNEEPAKPVIAAVLKKADYPIELALRPITLFQNLTEVSIAPHLQSSPFIASDAVHARYGITRQIQVGVTYVYAGVWDRQLIDTGDSSSYGFHSGKAFGVDVTYLLQDWIGISVGVPFYISPLAVALQIGVPLKFTFGDKFALGGLDDLLNINLHNFAPSFYQEFYNALAAASTAVNTEQSRGHLRFSAYGIYQQTPRWAWIGRIGIDSDLGEGGGGAAGTSENGGEQTFIKAGFSWTPKNFLDFGAQIGFDDLSTSGSFGPQLFLALRI
jgi:hypothetical protein